MDDAILRLLDSCPVITRELSGVVNHWTKWCAAFELWGGPGVPITDGVYGTVEVDLVQLAGTIVGVRIIPEQASFAGHLVQTVVRSSLTGKQQPLDCKVELIGCCETFNMLRESEANAMVGEVSGKVYEHFSLVTTVYLYISYKVSSGMS